MDDLISRKAVFELLDDIDSIYLEDYDDTFKSYTDLVNALFDEDRLPSAQPKTHDKRTKTHSCDLIDRQAAIDALQEHRNLFCDNTPETFSKLSYAEKSRVDELDMAIATLINLPYAQPDSKELSFTQKKLDTISRQAAIRWVKTECNPYGKPTLDFESGKKVIAHLKQMPSAQPDLSEYSDKLWKKAYERGKAEAHDEIVRCKDCKQFRRWIDTDICFCDITEAEMSDNDFCSKAERRTDDTD